MFNFFSPKKKNPPAWAAFFTPEEYGKFEHEVFRYFKRAFTEVELTDTGEIISEQQNYVLENLAINCKESRPSNYRSIIRDWFDGMRRADEWDRRFEKIIEDFDQVSKFIAVKLYNENFTSDPIMASGLNDSDYAVNKDFAGDIKLNLVFDKPTHISNIEPTLLEKWGKRLDDLVALGIENVKANYKFPIERYTTADGYSFSIIETKHMFSSNVVFDLYWKKELSGKFGALIGCPSRHKTLVYPFDNLDVLTVRFIMAGLIEEIYKSSQGRISDKLFWFDGSEFHVLHCKYKVGFKDFKAPPSFFEIIENLQNEAN